MGLETEGATTPLPDRIHDVINASLAQSPDKLALLDDFQSLTYRELDLAIGKTADLLTQSGVRPGDRILIVSENSVPLALLLFAASRLNIWAIVTNPRLSARELDQIWEHSGARRVFFAADISPEAARHAERHSGVVQADGPLKGVAMSASNEAAVAEQVADRADAQVAVLIYTSGTTGTPKGVMLSHRNLLSSGAITAKVRRMSSADKLYCVLPISHIVGISLLIMTLMTGGTVRLVRKYDPAALIEAMRDEGITILNGVPATYQRLFEYMNSIGQQKLDVGQLRLISVAGAPLDPELKGRTERYFGLPLLNGYGITECAPGISGVRLDDPQQDVSVGPLLPGVEARLVGKEGEVVDTGDIGELHVRGSNVMMGYYRAPDLTAKALTSDGWFNTGDLAKFSGQYLHIVGRTKEMIIRSGFNVYPAEIEAVLYGHPDVVQCAVVGRSVDGNEEVVAFVQLIAGSKVTMSDLTDFARARLTSYKRPSHIFALDALPATSTGKLLKHKLAERCANGIEEFLQTSS